MFYSHGAEGRTHNDNVTIINVSSGDETDHILKFHNIIFSAISLFSSVAGWICETLIFVDLSLVDSCNGGLRAASKLLSTHVNPNNFHCYSFICNYYNLKTINIHFKNNK